jgi:hypothetical protein
MNRRYYHERRAEKLQTHKNMGLQYIHYSSNPAFFLNPK